MRKTLTSFLDDCSKRGDQTAFAHKRGLRVARWSYARLQTTAFQFARELETRNIAKGDRVLFWAENSAEWVAAFFGCLLRGAIVVPLDLESAPEFASRVQQQVGAKLLLCGGGRQSVFDARLSVLPLEELSGAVARHSDEAYAVRDIEEGDLVEIIFTSGTTAEPKGVCLTHRNLLANLEPLEREIQKYIKWERPFHPVRFLDLLPLSHVFGQFMGIFVPQILGGEVFFQDSLNPSEIIEMVNKERISVTVAVPRLLDSLRIKVERDAAACGNSEEFRNQLEGAEGWSFLKRWWVFRRIHRQFGWKFWAFISGGAALDAETEKFWRRLGFVVVQGYGMTETASLISVNHPFKVARGSIGATLPGQEMKLDESGEILVRGENVSPGYWSGGVTPLTNDEGWLRTGDIGEMDEQGNLYFKGRKKDVIVTAAGMNIYPEDLEAALKAQPEIRDCAVIGIETAQGPELLAVLIPKDDAASLATVISRANKALAQHQQIRRWAVWPEQDFPRTPTQKIRKPAVLETMRRAEFSERRAINDDLRRDQNDYSPFFIPRSANPLSSILQQVARANGEAPAHIDASANLATDLKLDSLGRVELLSALEDHYQVDIDEAAFTAATTVADIEKMIREGGRASSVEYPYTKWAERFPVTWIRFAVFYLVLLPLTRMMSRAHVEGKQRLCDVHGPLLFVSNHVAMVDQSLIQAALPARFQRKLAIAMEGEKLRGWRHAPEGTGWFTRLIWLAQYALVVSLFNVFPLPQRSGFRQSFAHAGEAMDRGYSVLVFPEGRRTPDGKIHCFMEGIGLLAINLNVPVVPIRLDGLWEMKQRRKNFAKPGEITVKIGEPVLYSRDQAPAAITEDLQRRVESL